MQPRRLLVCFATWAHSWLMVNLVSIRTPRSFSAKLLSSWSAPACPGAWGSSSPEAGRGISLRWTSQGSCRPVSPTCWSPSEWHHNQLAYQSLLFIYTGLLTPLLDFLPIEMDQSWALKRQFLKINQLLWTALLFRALSHEILPWTAQSLLSWSPGLWSCYLPCSLFSGTWTAPSHGQPRLLLTFTYPTSFSLFVKVKCHKAPLHISSSITCVRKLLSMPSRNLLDCLCPAVLSLQQISGWLKIPMRISACKCEAHSSCLKKASSTLSSWSGIPEQTSTTTSPTLVCPLILTYKLSLAHHLSLSRGTGIPAALSRKAQLHLTFPACLSWFITVLLALRAHPLISNIPLSTRTR